MKWERKTLCDISLCIQTGPFGSQLHQSDYSESGIPVVMPKDIINGKIVEESIARVSMSHVQRLKKYAIKQGDILVSRRGDVGRCAFVTSKEHGWLCGTGCLCITLNTKVVNPRFIFYQLKKEDTIRWIENHAVGSTMLNLNTTILSNIPFFLPTLNVQNTIADILSAYDNLIENNQKQIKLLEEVAQRLYKEWFVDLRFPGYENVPIVDGVPEGWNKSLLKEISEFKRGKTITKDSVINGSIPVVAGGLEPAYYHNKANTTAPVITVSGSGANAGFTRLYYNDVWASDCSFVDSNNTEYIYFVYCFLKNNKDRIDNLQKGSAQPHVYAKDINALSLNLPNTEILNIFSEIIEPYFALIGKLQKQIRAAEQARDRLLPKLMSGELEV